MFLHRTISRNSSGEIRVIPSSLAFLALPDVEFLSRITRYVGAFVTESRLVPSLVLSDVGPVLTRQRNHVRFNGRILKLPISFTDGREESLFLNLLNRGESSVFRFSDLAY